MSKVYNDLRRAYLTQENIAREAYFVWERAGRPDGEQEFAGRKLRDNHWFSAIERLELAAEMDADHLSNCSDLGQQIFADGTCTQNCCSV